MWLGQREEGIIGDIKEKLIWEHADLRINLN